MELQGLDYNTQRDKLKLMAYGREIQQMVEVCMSLPTRAERQACAETIIDAMKHVVHSQLSMKERIPMLWYHLAMMSDFKLDVDYPVEIVHEDKMDVQPKKIPYKPERMHMRQYGRMIQGLCEKLKEMEPSDERNALAVDTANQMYRIMQQWGTATADKEKIVSDLARYTDGTVQMTPADITADKKNTKKRRK